MSDNGALTPDTAVIFMKAIARYFETRPTFGEDAAHWANIYNAENCRKVAALISELTEEKDRAASDGAAGTDTARRVAVRGTTTR